MVYEKKMKKICYSWLLLHCKRKFKFFDPTTVFAKRYWDMKKQMNEKMKFCEVKLMNLKRYYNWKILEN